MRYLYCYDIVNAKRLRKVSHTLEENGIRVQKSFFICDFEQTEAEKLLSELSDIINARVDSIFMYGICERCQSGAVAIGEGAYHVLEEYLIL